MPLIYDKVLTHFYGLNSVALNAKGDLAAACFNERELHVYRVIENPSQKVHPKMGALSEGGSLEEYRFIRLPAQRYNRPPEAEVNFRYSKLAFLNDETLMVAREIEQIGGGRAGPPVGERENISLVAVKIGTGGVIAEFTDSAYGPLFASPFLMPPNYVLFPAGHTAICIGATSFREVFRLRPPGEQIAHNGIVYDSKSGTLYVLWREFESAFLQSYRLHPDKGTYEDLERRPLELQGYLGNSLCVRPDGKEVAVWFTIMSGFVRRRTKTNWWNSTAQLGRLGIFSSQGDRYFDVHSQFEQYDWFTRDFKVMSVSGYDQKGAETETDIGILYAVDDLYKCKPFYLDDRTVVINSPGGKLIGVDTVTGNSEELMDEWRSIEDLYVHPQKQLLLVGKNGCGNVPAAIHLHGFA
jgi:hypothetical protein